MNTLNSALLAALFSGVGPKLSFAPGSYEPDIQSVARGSKEFNVEFLRFYTETCNGKPSSPRTAQHHFSRFCVLRSVAESWKPTKSVEIPTKSCHVTRHITDASGTEWCLLYSIMFGPRPNIWYNSKWSHIPTASLWKHATAFKVFVCHTESYYHDCAVMLSHAVYWCCKSFKYACCHLALASAFEFERLLPSAPTFSAYRSMMLRVLYIGCHGQNTNLPLQSALACFGTNRDPDWCSKGKAHRQERCSIPCCAN